MRVALVNTNRIQPPIAPIGLDYLAEALHAAGHQPELLDLCWEPDWEGAIARFFAHACYPLVGVTLRNTDDCAFTSRHSFLPETAAMVAAIRRHYEGLILLGGVGFSTLPEAVLALCPADAGIWGEGELPLVTVANRLEQGEEWLDTPGLVWRERARLRRNPPGYQALADLPAMSRGWVDNGRYFREGGQAGFETKRGCAGDCVYSADPVAKGRAVRLRPPAAVAGELEALLGQGIDHLHTCDSELNLPPEHAAAVCRELVARGLGERLRWYAYCAPAPFDRELAALLRRAGCVGINFGVDSGEAGMLARLGRDFAPEDILAAAQACREAGIAVMLDLLLGSPGETAQSLAATIELVRKADPDLVGISLGVRVYPGTALAREVGEGPGTVGEQGPGDPQFYLEPEVAPFAAELLDRLIEGDRRFLCFDPSRPQQNYNYHANQLLVEAIRRGERGAYWDILRRCQ